MVVLLLDDDDDMHRCCFGVCAGGVPTEVVDDSATILVVVVLDDTKDGALPTAPNSCEHRGAITNRENILIRVGFVFRHYARAYD